MWPIIVSIPMPFGWGPVKIPAFGFMVVLAFLTSTSLMRRLAKKEGIAPEKLEPLFMIILIGTVVGGRLFHVLTHLDEFQGHWIDAIRIDKGGMVMYGGMIAVVAGGLWYVWRAKLPVWDLADIGAVCGALALGIGRIGCMLAGCDYGKPVDRAFPLAVHFPSKGQPGSFFGISVPASADGLGPPGWVHPTQLYQSACGFLTFAFLWWLWRHRRFPGQVFAALLVLKPAYRFGIEFLRGDADRGFIGGLSQAQFIGILVAATGVVFWVVLRRRAKRLLPVPACAPPPAPAKDG
jgi:phosphatidylglycerol:prolipoprotein diacylglycerol transferase